MLDKNHVFIENEKMKNSKKILKRKIKFQWDFQKIKTTRFDGSTETTFYNKHGLPIRKIYTNPKEKK